MRATKHDVAMCMSLTASVINNAASRLMAAACMEASEPMDSSVFAGWLRRTRHTESMNFALMSLQTYHYLRNYSLGVKVHWVVDSPMHNPTVGIVPVGYVVRKAKNGYTGVCLAVTRLVEGDDVHLVKELPGWERC